MRIAQVTHQSQTALTVTLVTACGIVGNVCSQQYHTPAGCLSCARRARAVCALMCYQRECCSGLRAAQAPRTRASLREPKNVQLEVACAGVCASRAISLKIVHAPSRMHSARSRKQWAWEQKGPAGIPHCSATAYARQRHKRLRVRCECGRMQRRSSGPTAANPRMHVHLGSCTIAHGTAGSLGVACGCW